MTRSPFTTPVRLGAFVALAALAALAAALSVVLPEPRSRPGPAPAGHAARFLDEALGAPGRGSLRREPADGVRVAIGADGYTVALESGLSVTLSLLGADGSAWTTYENGAARRTGFGREVVTVEPRRTEQYLTISERQGTRTWQWRLEAAGLLPVLRADGGIDLLASGRAGDLAIPPVAILDGTGRDVTPGGLSWQLERDGAGWLVALELDDGDLPLPYVIDPGIVLRGTATAENGAGATTLVLPKPAGTVPGDLLVAQVTVRGGSGVTITAPAGWTSIRNTTNGANLRQAVYRRSAGASEPASYTFTLSSAQRAAGGIATYSGVELSSPVLASSQRTGSGTSVTANSVTPGVADSMLVAAFGTAVATTFTSPGGMTERWDLASTGGGGAATNATASMADAIQAGSGASGAKTATAAASAAWVAHLVALRPDVTNPTASTTAPTEGTNPGAQYYVSGSKTHWFRPDTNGSFTLGATASDTSGVQKVTFPDLSAVSGWAGAGGDDTSSPYASPTAYTWSSGASAPGAGSIVATDYAGNTGSDSITIAADSAAPTGLSASLLGGTWYTALSVPLTVVSGTDGESGLDAATLVVERASAMLASGVCGSFGAWSAVTLVGGADTSVASGSCYRYRVQVSDNVGNQATSAASADAHVDTSAPAAPALTVTESPASSAQHASGSTLYYRPGAAGGSFAVDATASDAESGVALVAFPAVAGLTGGGADATAPYQAVYTWDATTAAGGPQAVTATNGAGLAGAAATFDLQPDSAAPTGGSVSYPDGWNTTGSVTVTTADGADAGSGIDAASRTLERATATLTGGACGGYGAWTPVTSPDTLPGGTCAVYRYSVTDNVGNTATYTSPNVVMVDTSAPATPVLSFAESSAFVYASATTVWVNSGQAGTYDVTATADDVEAGIDRVTFPVAGDDTTAPYSATYATGDLTGAQTVTARAASGLTADAGFTVSDDTAAPAGGSVSYPDGWNTTGSVTVTTADGADAGSGIDAASRTLERATATLTGGACGGYGAWTPVTSPDTLPGGTCAVYRYSVTDNVGNTATHTSPNVVMVDLDGPTAIMLDPGANLSGSVALGSTADDPESGVASVVYEVAPAGAGTWTAVASPWDTTAVADGLYDLRVVVTNGVGVAVTSAPVTDRLVDNTAPGGSGGDPGAYLRGTVTLTATPADTGSGVASVAFEWRPAGGGAWSTIAVDADGSDGWSADWDTTAVADGDVDLHAVVTDLAANAAEIWLGTKTVDNTAPTATVDSGPADPTTSTSATLAFSASEAGATFECRLDGGAWSACVSPEAYSGLGLGGHAFDVRATDVAGNTGAPASVAWTVEAPPPPPPRADVNPPSAPAAFRGELDGGILVLRWSPATDGEGPIDAYLLFDRGALAETIDGGQLHARIGAWSAGDPRVFTLAAVDDGENVGPETPPLGAVPDLTGLTPEEAEASLAAHGFVVGVRLNEPSGSVSAGLVLRAGSPLATPGAAVDLIVSAGGEFQALGTLVLEVEPLLVTRTFAAGRRTLRVRIRLTQPAAVRLALHRLPRRVDGKPLVRDNAQLPAGVSVVALELGRAGLRPGRYLLLVRADTGEQEVTQRVRLRVSARR